MARHRSTLVVVLAVGLAWAGAGKPAEARHVQPVGTRPGIGVSGIGVPTVYIPAPGVATPTVPSTSVTTPMVTGNPGVASKNTSTQIAAANPGATARHVETQAVVAQPGVATHAAPVHTLPSGYYTSIPADALQVMYKGELVYSVNGKYYRPEYYMGNIVYVIVK